jgi:hypothetical protein
MAHALWCIQKVERPEMKNPVTTALVGKIAQYEYLKRITPRDTPESREIDRKLDKAYNAHRKYHEK